MVELEATVSEARMLLERERQKTTSLTKELRRISDMCSLLPALGLRSLYTCALLAVVAGKQYTLRHKTRTQTFDSLCVAFAAALPSRPVDSLDACRCLSLQHGPSV